MTVEVKKFSSNKNTNHLSKQKFYLKKKKKKLRIPTENFVEVNFFHHFCNNKTASASYFEFHLSHSQFQPHKRDD